MFWYIAQKDHVTAILSLAKIAQFNGVTFETVFADARSFLSKKSSKGSQCDFQPLVRLGKFFSTVSSSSFCSSFRGSEELGFEVSRLRHGRSGEQEQ